jgi:hypothetical protein
MSGFEIITITFSFILGLGMTQILRSVAYVVRERGQYRLHWNPFSVAALILTFQIQFWFAFVIVDSFLDQWSWPVYSVLLFLAIVIFLSGATVLPPSGSSKTSNLMEDFETRGKISLLFFASYFIGWIVIAIMFWSSDFEQLVVVNLVMAITAVVAFFAQKTTHAVSASRRNNCNNGLRFGCCVGDAQSGVVADIPFGPLAASRRPGR